MVRFWEIGAHHSCTECHFSISGVRNRNKIFQIWNEKKTPGFRTTMGLIRVKTGWIETVRIRTGTNQKHVESRSNGLNTAFNHLSIGFDPKGSNPGSPDLYYPFVGGCPLAQSVRPGDEVWVSLRLLLKHFYGWSTVENRRKLRIRNETNTSVSLQTLSE